LGKRGGVERRISPSLLIHPNLEDEIHLKGGRICTP
jgi:hypothetical protein